MLHAGKGDGIKAAKSKPQPPGKTERKAPTLGPMPGTDESVSDGPAFSGDQGELAIDEQPAPESAKQEKQPRQPAGPAPDRIVPLYLIARDNHVITGAQLLEAAVKTGMDFGQMDIFHRINEGETQSVFSLANAAKPGHFDRGAWPEFETSALVLFMTLPNPRSALDAWDAMLATGQPHGGHPQCRDSG